MTQETTSREYQDVIRVNINIIVLPGYKYIAQDQSYTPASLRYAREMTLARGRILYEAWDFHRSLFLGYIVPDQIYNEALANRHWDSFAAWSKVPAQVRSAYQNALTLILDRFPRIPRLAAKLVSERTCVKGISSSLANVEAAVVEHALYCWTSYEFRLEKIGVGREEAFKAITMRMRDVLGAWSSGTAGEEALADLWRKHGLLDDADVSQKAIPFGEADAFSPSILRWYCGAETPGNLISQPHVRI